MDYDFIVGFTLFYPSGFKTRFKHFDNLRVAKMFASNVNLKDNSKIYVDLKYLQDKIEPRLKELDEQMKKEWKEYGNSREYQDMEDEWNFLHSLFEKE